MWENVWTPWTRWLILWRSVSLFLQSLLSLHNGLVKEVAMEVGMEVMHELSKTDMCPTVLLWLQGMLSSQTANSKDQPWVPNMAQSMSQPSACRLVTLDDFHHGRGGIRSQENRSFLDLDLPFLLKATVCGLKKCVFAVIISHANWIWPVATLRGCNEFMLMKVIDFYLVFHNLD